MLFSTFTLEKKHFYITKEANLLLMGLGAIAECIIRVTMN